MNKNFADKLNEGETVSFKPRGNSMKPKINSGDLITVSPDISDISKGDIVFCKVKGKYYVHLIKAVSKNRFQIGNNHGRVNGWTKQVYGKVIEIL